MKKNTQNYRFCKGYVFLNFIILLLFPFFYGQAQDCGPIVTLYQTFGTPNPGGVAQVKQYNQFSQSFVAIGSLAGAPRTSATNSAYNVNTGYIYSAPANNGNTIRVYDPNDFSLVGTINMSGNTGGTNNTMFANGDRIGFIKLGTKIVSLDVSGITDPIPFNVTIPVVEEPINTGGSFTFPSNISDFSLFGGTVYGVNGLTETAPGSGIYTTFLYVVDLSTGDATQRLLNIDYSLDNIEPVNEFFGATWKDLDGNLYAFNNSSGGIYRLDDAELNTSTTLRKIFIAEPTNTNDGFACELVRDFLDYDSDGVSDDVDLDNDNDGILDVNEGDGSGLDPDDIQGINGEPNYRNPSVAGFVDTNGDGINDNFDRDLDSIPDAYDFDSDNDGCSDANEAYASLTADGGDGGFYGADDPIPSIDNGLVDANGLVIAAGVTGNTYDTTPATSVTPAGNTTQIATQVLVDATDLIDQTVVSGATTFAPTDATALSTTTYTTPGTPDYTASPTDVSSTIVYQWQKNGVNLSNEGVYSGTDTFMLGISDVTGLDGTIYNLIVTHPDNVCVIIENAATLNVDHDNDGFNDTDDLDDDNDGILDTVENNGNDPFLDGDNDGIPAYLDNDDGDASVGDTDNAIQPGFDTDGDGVIDQLDLDSDNDGIYDVIEAGGTPSAANPGQADGAVGTTPPTNGIPASAGTGLVPIATTTGTPDYLNLDSDGDGCTDADEAYNDNDADGDDGGQFGTTDPATVDDNGLVTEIGIDYSLGTNASVTDANVGICLPIISGHLYADTNGNGIQDNGEVNLSGVTINITEFGGGTQTVDTDANGNWSAIVPAGDTNIDIDNADLPTGSTQTQGAPDPDTITAVAGVNTSGADDGFLFQVPDELHATPECTDTVYSFIWNSNAPDGINEFEYTPVGALTNTFNNIGGSGVNLTHNFTGDTGTLGNWDSAQSGIANDISPSIGSNATRGYKEVLQIFTDGFTSASGITQTITFSGGTTVVYSVGFDLYNVDKFGSNGDEFTITAINTLGNTIYPDFSTPTTPNYTFDEDTGIVDATTRTNSFINGQLGINFSDINGISSIIVQWNNCSTCTNIKHGYGFGNFDFCVVLPNDNDNDGVADNVDPDDDNDGILDVDENDGTDPFDDADMDGTPDYLDPDFGDDDNMDGIIDVFDVDGDGVINQFDLDSDNDGLPDVIEAGGIDADGDGVLDGGDADADGLIDTVDNVDSGSGTGEVTDGTPLTVPDSEATPDGLPDYLDIDADGDGIPDNIEGQTSGGYIPPGTFTDTDGDGLNDVYDGDDGTTVGIDPIGVAIDPENTDGIDTADYLDTDSDNDGVLDITENGDTDNTPSGNDADGDGLDDAFDDNDDSTEVGATVNDGLGTGDVVTDSTTLEDAYGDADNDFPGTGDVDYRDIEDNDNDGVADNVDPDDDNDGILDVDENDGTDPFDDADMDGTPD
ncbi:beta strand repeat-containing protein, partial [Aquimarina addita]